MEYDDEDEDEFDVMMVRLGFCTCGNPEYALDYIQKGLLAIKQNQEDRNWDTLCSKFGSMGELFFFLYWADKENLTEHGGSVGGGWLEESGERLLDQLTKLKDIDKL